MSPVLVCTQHCLHSRQLVQRCLQLPLLLVLSGSQLATKRKNFPGSIPVSATPPPPPPPQPTPLHFIYHKTCLMLIYKALPLYPSIGLLWAQSHQLSLSLSIYCHTPRFFFSHSPRPSNICHGKLKSVRKLNSHIAGMYMTSQAACSQTAKEHGRGFNQLLGVCS